MRTFTLLLLLVAGAFTSSLSAQDTLVLTLEKALELANQQSPELMSSRRALQQSERQMVMNKADLKPNLRLSFTPFSYDRRNAFAEHNSRYNLTESMSSSIGLSVSQKVKFTGGTLNLSEGINWSDYKNKSTNTFSSDFSNNLSIRYEQPIFKYNEIKLNSRAQELSLENSKLSYAIQVIQMEQTITNAFYGVYSSYKSLKNTEEAYKNQEETHNLIKNKVESKLMAEAELFQQEINLANQKDALASAIDSYQGVKDEFKKTLGLPLDMDIMVIPDTSIVPVYVNAELATQYALQQRMQLRQRQIGLEQDELSLIATKAEDKFSGNLSFSVGISGNDKKFEQVFQNQNHNEGFALSLTIPIWDWGIRKNRIRNAEQNLEDTRLTIEEEKKSVEIRIRELCRNLPRLLNKIELSQKSIENAERTYKINQERYTNNAITAMDFKNYQEQLTSAQQAYTDAIIAYKRQLLEIKIYTLWDFENNHSILPVDLLK